MAKTTMGQLIINFTMPGEHTVEEIKATPWNWLENKRCLTYEIIDGSAATIESEPQTNKKIRFVNEYKKLIAGIIGKDYIAKKGYKLGLRPYSSSCDDYGIDIKRKYSANNSFERFFRINFKKSDNIIALEWYNRDEGHKNVRVCLADPNFNKQFLETFKVAEVESDD